MPASAARIEANRRNAQHSTGPKTEAGKAVSRANALKHGLAGAGVVRPDAEADLVARRAAAWKVTFGPEDDYEDWLVDQLALASARIDRCAELDRAGRQELIDRAGTSWDADRRLAAEALAKRLSREPELVVLQLQQTAQGCACLIERWDRLLAIHDALGPWDVERRSLAYDLLGMPSLFRLDDEDLLAPARAEHARLLRLKAEVLDEQDASERAIALAGLALDTSAPARLLLRYEAACHRVMERSIRQFRSRPPAPAFPESHRPAESPRPTPTPPPAAAPTPPPAAAPRQPLPNEPNARPFLVPSILPNEANAPPLNRRARRAAARHARPFAPARPNPGAKA